MAQDTRNAKEWVVALAGIAGILALTAALVAAGSGYSATYLGWPVFLICAIFAFVVQWVMFVHAWLTKTEHFFDLTGSVTYIVMVLLALTLSGSSGARSWVLAVCIIVWAARLGTFLFRRIRAAGEDRRFRSIKTSFPTFLMTWTLQGGWVFITACCALAAMSSTARVEPDVSLFLGLALWLFGFLVEVTADRQKSIFKADPANENKFITSGLWAWSRHPNYFGEIVLWSGIALMAYPVLQGWQTVTLISPLFVVFLLTFVSGVRMLEARAEKQWGDDPDYRRYKANTPALMLWPPGDG